MQQILESSVILRNRYEIRELVGQGGMGAVYKANDLRLEGRVCAVKEILPALASNASSETEIEQLSQQFRTEASTLARLDHPNLPKVSDYFTIQSREYLVMDFVEGRDLQEIVEDAQRQTMFLDEQEVLSWISQLLDAIEYLHDQTPPVLHRDVKPSNIKLTPRGTIKLVDFGLVKVLEPDESRTVTVVQGRGTVAYTPLEQYGGDTGFTDTRSDIYSIGATLYHLLTGQLPVDAKERFLHPGALIPVRQINPAISARTERTTFQALGMHPSERPATVRELRTLLYGSAMANTLSGTMPGAMATPISPTITPQLPLFHPQLDWSEVFRQNSILIGAALLLLMIAIVVSL